MGVCVLTSMSIANSTMRSFDAVLNALTIANHKWISLDMPNIFPCIREWKCTKLLLCRGYLT